VKRRRLRVAAVVAAVVGLFVAGVIDDARVQLHLHHDNARLASSRVLLHHTTDQVAVSGTSLRATEAGRTATQKRLSQVTTELASTEQRLAQAETGAAAQNVQLSSVHDCAHGVNRSVAALQSGNQSLAVSDLSAVASVCEHILGAQTGGPVYPFDFADPFVLVAKGTYFAYGTNSTAGNIQIMQSSDLVHWKKAGDALPTLPPWAKSGDTWAPAVIRLKRSYVLYYTAATARGTVQCLSAATARRPQGPFRDTSKAPLECQPTLGGSIDASPYVDAGGRPYLAWKSIGADGQPATIWAQALTATGTALAGPGPTALLRPSQSWEGSVVEAPTMILSGATYLLLYSANNWNSAHYAVGQARCSGPLGPCTKALSTPLLASEPGLEGPGGEAVFTDEQGHLQMAFQAWLPGAVGYPHSRLLFIRPLAVVNGVARLGAPG
jgi:hypothetical protein